MNNYILFFIKSILLSLEIHIISSLCPRNNPFLKDNVCVSSCTSEEIEDNSCIINNEIVKTQWLNNIIFLNFSNCFYLNLHVSENNTLYSLTSRYPPSNTRIMYILNKEGYGYINKNDPLINLALNDPENKGRFESELFSIQFSNREYLISIGKAPQFVEIYDLYENKIYFKLVQNYFDYESDIYTKVVPHIKLYSNENRNIYLIGLLVNENNYQGYQDHYFHLKKVDFTSVDIRYNQPSSQTIKFPCSKSIIISCFITNNNFIVCFYNNINYQYTIIVLNLDLVEQKNMTIANGRPNEENEELFFKCIHFFGESGVFVYFTNEEDALPVFQFKNYSNIENSITDVFATVSKITIDNYIFNRIVVNSCDMIKVEDKKFYFAGILINKDKIIIISFYNYKEDKFVYNIYSIDLKIYNSNFAEYIKLELYNNFLVLGSNYIDYVCPGRNSFIMICSYPNTTEVDIDLIDYLSKNNKTTRIDNLILELNGDRIDNLILELNGEYTIDNNIFGYIFSGIQIIENCLDLDNIYLVDLNNVSISNNYFLPKNEKIKLKIPQKENYKPFLCKTRYAAVVSEPDYSQYKKYPIDIVHIGEPEDEEAFFNDNKKYYIGRYSFYNFILKDELTTIDCEDINCELCYNNDKTKCIKYLEVFNTVNTEETNSVETNQIDSDIVDSNLINTDIRDTSSINNIVDINSIESNSDSVDTGLVDINTMDTNSRDSNSLDTNTETTNEMDTNSRDSNSLDTNTEATNEMDTNSRNTNSVDTNTEVTNEMDTHSRDTNSIDSNSADSFNDNQYFEYDKKEILENIKSNNISNILTDSLISNIINEKKDLIIKNENENVIYQMTAKIIIYQKYI